METQGSRHGLLVHLFCFKLCLLVFKKRFLHPRSPGTVRHPYNFYGKVDVAVVCVLISEADILTLGIKMLFSAYFVTRASVVKNFRKTAQAIM